MGRPKVLLVDDCKVVHKVVVQMYGDSYDFTCVQSPEAAVTALLTGESPDVVLLDVQLGPRLGTELLETLRNHRVVSHVKDLPVVMLTEDRSGAVYEMSMWLGAVAYVTKPIEYEGLGEALRSVVAERGRMSA